jgi:hypothetical protein
MKRVGEGDPWRALVMNQDRYCRLGASQAVSSEQPCVYGIRCPAIEPARIEGGEWFFNPPSHETDQRIDVKG